MTTHGDPRYAYRNTIKRAAMRQDQYYKGREWAIKKKPWRKRKPENQARYDKAVEFNRAHGLRPCKSQRLPAFKGRQRRSQKRVTLPTFKSE